jgi:hypothetical protein
LIDRKLVVNEPNALVKVVQFVEQVGIERDRVEDLDGILDVLFEEQLHVRMERLDAVLRHRAVTKT